MILSDQKTKLIGLLWPHDGVFPGPWIKNIDLNKVCLAYSQRLGELEKLGYEHETRKAEVGKGVYEYRLVRVPSLSASFSLNQLRAVHWCPLTAARSPLYPNK